MGCSINIVICNFLGADVYNCILCFVCVYLCVRVRAHTHSMECGLFIRVKTDLWLGEEWLGRALNIPPTPDAPLCCTCGGACFGLKERRKECRLNGSDVEIQSHRNGKPHFRHGGKFPSNSSFLCNLC